MHLDQKKLVKLNIFHDIWGKWTDFLKPISPENVFYAKKSKRVLPPLACILNLLRKIFSSKIHLLTHTSVFQNFIFMDSPYWWDLLTRKKRFFEKKCEKCNFFAHFWIKPPRKRCRKMQLFGFSTIFWSQGCSKLDFKNGRVWGGVAKLAIWWFDSVTHDVLVGSAAIKTF